MKAADVDSFRGFLTARAPFEILLTNSNWVWEYQLLSGKVVSCDRLCFKDIPLDFFNILSSRHHVR
jgi:hypothetical protein